MDGSVSRSQSVPSVGWSGFLHPTEETSPAEWIRNAQLTIEEEKGGDEKAKAVFHAIAEDLEATAIVACASPSSSPKGSLKDYLISMLSEESSCSRNEKIKLIDSFFDLYTEAASAARMGNDEAQTVADSMKTVARQILDAPTSHLEQLNDSAMGGTGFAFLVGQTIKEAMSPAVQKVASVTGLSSPLHDAILKGDVQKLRLEIAAGADVNQAVHFYGSPLKYAVNCKNPEVVKLLVKAGADPLLDKKFAGSPFAAAVKSGNIPLIKAFVAGGFDLNTEERFRRTPLLWALLDEEDLGMIQSLAKAGADLDFCSSRGEIVLVEAASRNNVEAVKLLAEMGADLERCDKWSNTPLRVTDQTETIQALVEAGADLEARGSDGLTPLMYAVSCNNSRYIKALLAAGSKIDARGDSDALPLAGFTPLDYATSIGNNNAIHALLEAGATQSLPNLDGTSSSEVDRGPLIAAMLQHNGDAFRTALQGLVGGNSPDIEGKNQSASTVVYSNEDIVSALREAMLEDDFSNADGCIPLHWAISQNDRDLLVDLVKSGANPNAKDSSDSTPLEYAMSEGKEAMIDVLWAVGADLEALDKNSDSAIKRAILKDDKKIVRAIGRRLPDLNTPNDKGIPPMMTAIWYEKKDSISGLIEAGADVNSIKTGSTPLDYAIQKNKGAMVRALVEAGADVDLVSPSSRCTPLMTAANMGDEESVALLLESGADPNQGVGGDTPLAYAAKDGSYEVFSLLLEAGVSIPKEGIEADILLQAAVFGANDKIYRRILDSGAKVFTNRVSVRSLTLDFGQKCAQACASAAFSRIKKTVCLETENQLK
ncbi:hypothetical protein SCG7086_CU_00020 [Chlamydiales bacterium SCGC AG-110-P3]|nr:hypothetical protein SCG7086_CU_00020 [Chlamydiales bacterium SCGC AG-110-P3]